eukprot:3142936-Rhodomonas_salina.1
MPCPHPPCVWSAHVCRRGLNGNERRRRSGGGSERCTRGKDGDTERGREGEASATSREEKKTQCCEERGQIPRWK